MARRLAAGCARSGLVVVSGLARGIDTEAHQAALAAGGRTWAVLGSGLERIYPAENAPLAAAIVAGGGAVLSELEPRTPPEKFHFPRRNRIISGLSWAVVVVEGDPKSGSLITARWAADQGRAVLAVPGPADSPLSEGPHDLLRAGAAPAIDVRDVLAFLPEWARGAENAPEPGGAKPPAGAESGGEATPDPEKILDFLGPHALSLEELAEGTGWAVPRVLAALAELEARGSVSPLPGQHYAIDQGTQG
jgi:DNA processing protein